MLTTTRTPVEVKEILMKYDLVYMEKGVKKTQGFESVWGALKEALRRLDRELDVIGITCGVDLFKEPEFVLRSGGILTISLSMGNCPEGFIDEYEKTQSKKIANVEETC